MEILSSQLESYLEKHISSESELLKRLQRETFQKTTQPQMLSGAHQGRLLSMISKLIRPKTILEIGTFTGYATLCLAEGLAPDGKIITIDRNEELIYLPKKYFAESEFANQIEVKLGNALDVLDELQNETYDLVFIDADKSNYINYYEKVLTQMNSGGVILADNVLWYGKVLEEAKPNDKDTKTLQELNDLVANDPRVESLILPIRDGISIIRKI
ncbi:O-methyltransferase [Moheibacter stercoris]|uniref:O-methyltransferase YrrM n=1 Tax=Moheibacter stercoris TaxID=1628251 RepID=A0ABV2LQX0_9FLAO